MPVVVCKHAVPSGNSDREAPASHLYEVGLNSPGHVFEIFQAVCSWAPDPHRQLAVLADLNTLEEMGSEGTVWDHLP